MIKKILDFFKKPIPKEKIYIYVVKEFSDFTGVRYCSDAPYSGELFRKTLLLPRFQQAVSEDKILIVNLDGAFGYTCSFLDEAFGGLIRIHHCTLENVKKHLQIISDEEPHLIVEITRYLEEADKTKELK